MPSVSAATRPYSSKPAAASPLIPALAAAVGAVSCFLPWFRVDLSKVGAALDHAAGNAFAQMGDVQIEGASLSGFGESVNGLFGSMNIQGTVNAAGVDGWVGIAVLVLLGASAMLQLVSASNDGASARSMVQLSLVGSVLAVGLTFYACTQLGGPVGPHVGLGLAVVGAAVATATSIRRVGSLQAAA